jgi:hypothetical protein
MNLTDLHALPADGRRLTDKEVARVLTTHRFRRIAAADAMAILQRPSMTVAPGTIEAAHAHITATAESLNLVNPQIKDVTPAVGMPLWSNWPDQRPSRGKRPNSATRRSCASCVGRIVLARM